MCVDCWTRSERCYFSFIRHSVNRRAHFSKSLPRESLEAGKRALPYTAEPLINVNEAKTEAESRQIEAKCKPRPELCVCGSGPFREPHKYTKVIIRQLEVEEHTYFSVRKATRTSPFVVCSALCSAPARVERKRAGTAKDTEWKNNIEEAREREAASRNPALSQYLVPGRAARRATQIESGRRRKSGIAVHIFTHIRPDSLFLFSNAFYTSLRRTLRLLQR